MFDTKTLDKETEQVRSTWSRYRGGRGTYVGVTGRTCVGVSGQRSCPEQTCAGDSRDSTKPLSIIGNILALALYSILTRLYIL